MKPIKLTIKGINSFIEAQEIDFAKLTKQGLFGIFGATGSGKSTILDGITLALYGEVARKSANYINTNCDTAYVSYEFQISGQVAKRYRVDREFKRDKKTDSIRTKSAKIVEISGDNDIVLEDMVKSVTAKCEEIIGLKLDDFTRTVVLPQGKFSEFLKLTGSERSKMLERLFNLQKYGDDLSSKLIRKIRAERNNASRLEGELNGYEGCNAISLKEKNKEFAKMQTQFTQCKIENDIASENYKSGEILWNLQIELKKEKDKETRKKEDDEQIAVMQKKVVLGESALKVKPYIDPYEETQENLKKTEKEIQELADKMSVIAVDRKKIETTFEAAQSRKEKDLSKLKIEEHQVKEAIVEKVKLDELLKETSDVSENISRLKTKIKAAVTAIEINEKNSKIINGEISTREAKIEELRVSEDYKSRINNGVLILSDYKSLTKQTDDLVKIIDTKKAIIAKEKTEKDKKFNEFTQKTEEENRVATLLNQLVEHCPGDQDAVLKLRDRLSEVKIKWDKDSECNTSLQKAKAVIELLTKKISDKTLECDLLINEITKIAENIQKVEREHVAYSLRVAMVQGDICPVCGSREHSIESVEIPEMDNLETLKAQLQEKTERNQKASAEILTAQSSLEQQNQLILENKQKLLELGEDYKSVTVETLNVEFEALKSGLEKYNKDKADLENKIKIVTQEKNKLEIDYKEIDTLIKEQENQIKDYTENLTKIKKEVEKAQNKLAELKE
ncbi:MAG: AAA family ATPase, partial [Lachnotalea sp.]